MKLYSAFLVLALPAVSLAVHAGTIYVPIWMQDFEDGQTYTNELYYGKLECSLLGTPAKAVETIAAHNTTDKYHPYTVHNESWTPSGSSCTSTISPETRTRYESGTAVESSTYMRGYTYGKADTNLMLLIPSNTVSAMSSAEDYILEFDYYLAPSYGNSNNNATNGLVIATQDGDFVTIFGTTYGGDGTTSDKGMLFTADSPDNIVASAIRVGPRGSSDYAGLWMHVTIAATNDVLTLAVMQERGATILAPTKIRDKFAVVDRLYLRSYAEAWAACVCLDDVSVSTPVEADEYEWCNGTGDGKWRTRGNWKVAGEVVGKIPEPYANVRFSASSDVTLTNAVVVGDAAFDADITFKGGKMFKASSYLGDGKITLAGAGITTWLTTQTFDITNDIEIAEGTTNTICTSYYGTETSQSVKLNLYGDISGSGYVKFTVPATGQRGGSYLYGDNTAFTGVGVFDRPSARNAYRFMSPAATGTDARWDVGSSPWAGNTFYIFNSDTEKEWEIGAIDGSIYHYNGNGTPAAEEVHLILGSRPEDSALSGTWADARSYSSGCGVEWMAATNTLKYSVAKTAFIRLAGGGTVDVTSEAAFPIASADEETLQDGEGIIFELDGGVLKVSGATTTYDTTDNGDGTITTNSTTVTYADPSGVLRESTAPMTFDDEGISRSWTNVIESSNIAGFVKRGEGTLTLAAAPQYSGLTIVEAGTLVISNAVTLAVGTNTVATIDAEGTATLVHGEETAVAMVGAVSYTDFAAALSACRASAGEKVLTLLADAASNIALDLGESILICDLDYSFGFTIPADCRMESEEQDSGVVKWTLTLDTVYVTAPVVANTSFVATTNGVTVATGEDGRLCVLRNQEILFTWTAADGFEMNMTTTTFTPTEDENEIDYYALPFALDTSATSTIARLKDTDNATESYAPSGELVTLSVEAKTTVWTLKLSDKFSVSNIVFVTGAATLVVQPWDGFADGATLVAWEVSCPVEAFALPSSLDSAWVLRSESDGLKIYKRSLSSLNGVEYKSVDEAFSEAADGDTVLLECESWLLERVDISDDKSITLDLGGHRLKSAVRWAFNVGDGALTVTNGTMECGENYGFYVTGGSLCLVDCGITSTNRIAQIRGAGTVEVAPSATLAVSGDDPVIFAIGGLDGKANVVSQGKLLQGYSGGSEEDTTAYCVAGNPDDTFGATFCLTSSNGVYSTSAADSCLYHPDEQGGDVSIAGGWFSKEPETDWIAEDYRAFSETLDDVDGWRVLYWVRNITDTDEIPGVLEYAEDGKSLAANIDTLDEYKAFKAWEKAHSGVRTADRAYLAFALDSQNLLNGESINPDDITVDNFAVNESEEGGFAVEISLGDIGIGTGDDNTGDRLLKVISLAGATNLDDLATGDEISPKSAELEDGKVKLVFTNEIDKVLYMRVRVAQTVSASQE